MAEPWAAFREDDLTARKPTIDDVAAHSGVGRATVSRVLNDRPNVSAKVRERVRQAVEALGYQVNIQARFLAGGASRTVMLICSSDVDSEPNSYYQSALEVGALRACAPLGFELVTQAVVQHSPDRNARILHLVAGSRCSGVILTPPFSDDEALARELTERKHSVVRISPGPLTRSSTPAVSMDDEAAGFELASYLLDLGHRRFGFIKGLEEHLAAEQRYSGVARALRSRGLAETATVARRGNFTFKSGRDLLPELLATSPVPSAVICANDDTAAGALFAAHQLGVAVPGELSITGFDDTPVSAIVWPPLTTVHQPLQHMSRRAVEIIDDLLRSSADTPRCEMLAHSVVERGSTAPPAS